MCFLATSGVVAAYRPGPLASPSLHVTGLTLLRGLLGATSITCFYLAIELLPLQGGAGRGGRALGEEKGKWGQARIVWWPRAERHRGGWRGPQVEGGRTGVTT